MAIEFKEARTILTEQINKFLLDSVEQEKKADIAEMKDCFFDDILSSREKSNDELSGSSHIQIPDNETMFVDSTGNEFSYFGDPVWYGYKKSGECIPVYFAKNHPSRPYLDFNAPDAKALKVFEKLVGYSMWPEKNLSRRPISISSVNSQMTAFRCFEEWLFKNGYLRSDDIVNRPPSAHLITEEILRTELNRLITENEPASKVQAFYQSISLWVQLGRKPYCPDWLKPSFEYEDIIDKKEARRIAAYLSENRSRWEAIDFDDLEPMLMTAKTYIENFAADILWLDGKISEAASVNTSKNYVRLANTGTTDKIYKQIMTRNFSVSPNTGKPWFEARCSYIQGRYQTISKPDITAETDILIGACIFILLTFTGMRHEEFLHLLIEALTINGKPLNYDVDALNQVESAGENAFNLTRPIFKTDPYGREHTTPVPKIAAKAFALLVEIYRYSRGSIETDYLIPAGKLRHPDSPKFKGRKKFTGKIYKKVKKFCAAAGVQYHFPHKCRKTLATLLINHDSSSLEIIRFLLGHNSVSMTMEYIMALPGINEEILDHMREHRANQMTALILDAVEGKLAGPAGNRVLNSMNEHLKEWSGLRIPQTIKTLVKSLDNANIFFHRTPAAWCLRYPSQVPHAAPCLPNHIQEAIENGESILGEDVFVNPEHCIPHLCRDACHSTSDLGVVRRARQWSSLKLSSSTTKGALLKYEEDLNCWAEVEAQLENGRADIVGLDLLAEFRQGVQ